MERFLVHTERLLKGLGNEAADNRVAQLAIVVEFEELEVTSKKEEPN